MDQKDNGWGFYVTIDEPPTRKVPFLVYKKCFKNNPNPYHKITISNMKTISEENEEEEMDRKLNFALELGVDFEENYESIQKKVSNKKNKNKNNITTSFCFILIMFTIMFLINQH